MNDNFNLLNNIEVDLDKYIDLDINKEKLKQNMRSKIKEKRKSNKRLIAIASVSAIILGTISIGVINPTLADSIPKVYNIFKEFNYKLNLGYIDYNDISPVGISKTSNGTSITIEEAISDGSNIFLTYSIKSDKKIPRSGENIPQEYRTEDFDINKGELLLYGKVKSRTKNISVSGSSPREGYFKDDYNFIGMSIYSVTSNELEMPNYVNFELEIDSLGHVNTDYEDMIKGDWKFNLNIPTKSKLKTIKVNEAKDGFKVNNVYISPYSINVDVEFPESFVATKEEEKNNIEKRLRIDLNETKDLYWNSLTKDEVKHGNKYNYISSKNEVVKIRPSIMLDSNYIKEDPETLRVSFDNVKKGKDREKIIFNIDLNNAK